MATGGAGGMTTGGTGGTGGSSADCTSAILAIKAQMAGVLACTSVVRLDYQTLAIKGVRFLCGAYAAPTEAQARATAQADTGYGQSGQLLSGATPMDEFVFYTQPLDLGGVGVVSAQSGMSVFGGSIVWLGGGQITYPTSFEPGSNLASGCTNTTPEPSARGWDLRDGTPLSTADVKAALDVVWGTALPDALTQVGGVFDAVVLLYPPTMGVFDPNVAEWIVMVNSGSLD